jgi:Common central domain of tyrosinase/Polyphenol oxidase middle domain/Protein of unknown function (DUF_B2219)
MKKIILLSVVFSFFILAVVSFTKKQPVRVFAQTTKAPIVECPPTAGDLYINACNGTSLPITSLLIRRDYNTLTPAQRINFALAINRMKSLPNSDQRSWDFQVKIHGGPIRLSEPTWGTCQHRNCFFLAWHRMYIYYFERILRKYMIGPASSKPALPYWNYTVNGHVPSDFFTPASITSNPLYDAKRSMNSISSSIPSSIGIDINNAMVNNTNFYAFQNALSNPHSSLHDAVGTFWIDPILGFQKGDMNNQDIASNDPLFFLHHANMDRFWVKWLAMGSGRANPNERCDGLWWNKSFTFYDENKLPVTMTGKQIVQLGTTCLGYKYDNVPIVPAAAPATCPILSNCPFPPAIIIIINPNIYINNQRIYKMNFTTVEFSKNFDSLVSKNEKINFEKDGSGDNVMLEFEKINSIRPPKGVMEIYVNPKGESERDLQPQNASFAGLLDLFTSTGKHAHEGMKEESEKSKVSININHVLKKLNLSLEDLRKLRIVFVARGNNNNGIEEKTTAKIKIGKVSLAMYKN